MKKKRDVYCESCGAKIGGRGAWHHDDDCATLVDHGTPTGESLSEQLDAAIEQFGPNVLVSKSPKGSDSAEFHWQHAARAAELASVTEAGRHWERADFVVKTSTKQHLVAADNPNVNDRAWLVVADEEDWANVGTFKGNDYVLDATLLFRASAPEDEVTREAVPPRAELLREAEGLITGDRNKSYGSPTENFANIAALFNTQFGHMLKPGHAFTAAQVSQAMIHVKMARLIAQPKRDNYLDIVGYAGCGWEAEEQS